MRMGPLGGLGQKVAFDSCHRAMGQPSFRAEPRDDAIISFGPLAKF